MRLSVCSGCRRHVGSSERACPFCGAERTPTAAIATRVLGRLSRAAVFVGAAGCYTGSSPPASDQTHVVSNKGNDQPPDNGTAKFPLPMPTTGMATVGGTVSDRANSQPLANVYVQLTPFSGAKTQSVQSDSNGHYVFANVAPGKYQLQFKPQNSNPGMASYPNEVDLPAGQATRFDTAVELYDPANIPMPYGAPPQRRRLV